MGISNVLRLLAPLWLSIFFILLVTNFSFLLASSTDNSTIATFDNENNGNMAFSSSSNPPTPLAPPPQVQPLYKSKASSFRPSIAVIVGVLTIIFSITFLLLLYAKHCRRGDNNSNAFFNNNLVGYPPATARKNSGIDRAVIESLPIFRFASLRGQKDGLECAVCLNKFEPTEVLRLLPKCKHAFHVECVDTWLDAHSTCPLCRYRVDPEDILLVEDNRILYQNDFSKVPPVQQSPRELGSVSRVSGRHSFAGSSLEVIAERGKCDSMSFVPRRSLDSWNSKKKRNSEIVTVGFFDRPRKDGLLLADKTTTITSATAQRRLEHRIIVSGGTELGSDHGPNRRWSDVQPSDLFFLQSEMILSDSHRLRGGSRPSVSGGDSDGGIDEMNNNCPTSGRNEINARSVSEITGLSRFRSNEQQYEYQQRQQRQAEQRQRQSGAVSRWLAWISQPQTLQNPAVPPPSYSSSSTSSSTTTISSLVIV